jgi:ubiquinone biosynthesis protein
MRMIFMAGFMRVVRYRRLKRYNQIINVLIKNGFGHLVQKTGVLGVFNRSKSAMDKNFEDVPKISKPERVRKVIEELGPTFIKLGQILSTRPDLLPAEYINELKNLQDNAIKISFEKIKKVIENQIGDNIENIFEYIEEEPLAAASIAQVHRARLLTGEDVVVKVMKPEIFSTIENDLSILYDIATLVEDKIEKSYIYQPVNMVEELSDAIKKELDFTREARNTDKFAKHYKNNKEVFVPHIYWEYTHKRVIVMEYVDGIKVNDLKGLKEKNIDTKKLARTVADCFMNQVFKQGYFHADPHPGNILVLDDSKIALIDFGMVGTIDDWMMNTLLSLLVNIVEKDIKRTTHFIIKIGIPRKEVNEAALRKDVKEFIDEYYDKSLEEIEVSTALNDVFGIALRHGISMPSQLTLLVKALVTIEGVVLEIDSSFKLIEVLKHYTKKAVKDRYKPANMYREIKDYIEELFDNISNMPMQLSDLLTKINSDKIKVDIVHSGFDELIFNMNKMVNRVVLAIVVAAIIVGSALLAQVPGKQKVFGVPVIGFAGFLFGGIIGIWIIVSIMRSGKA